jgi:hypothetical protein
MDSESRSSGQTFSTSQMGTIPVSGNNPTGLALIASGVQGKTGRAASVGYLPGFRERYRIAEIAQEMSVKTRNCRAKPNQRFGSIRQQGGDSQIRSLSTIAALCKNLRRSR